MKSIFLVLTTAVVLLVDGSFAQESQIGSSWTVENLGPSINTEYAERFSMISSDGLVLYFASNRPEGLGEADEYGLKPWDMYVAWRARTDEPFGEPINLGPTVNSPYGDHSAALSEDGHWMYFTSARPGGCGGYDLFASYREDLTDHLAWGPPRHLGCEVNTELDEACPFFITDESSGEPLFYFVRDTEPGKQNLDIFLSEVGSDMRPLGAGSLVQELSSPAVDGHFDPRHGFIASAREGGYGGPDVWRSEMPQRNVWSRPINMGPEINTEYAETLPSASNDGTLYFPSNRPGGFGDFDIYFAIPRGL